MIKRARTKVVVTGMGAVTPLGGDVRKSWSALIAGKDAVSPVSIFDTTGCRSNHAASAELPDIPGFNAKSISRLPRAARLALPAAKEAMQSAGLLDEAGVSRVNPLALSISTSAGGIGFGEEFLSVHLKDSRRRGLLALAARYQPQQQIIEIQKYLSFDGPVSIVANACASGANAVGHAADWIRCGWHDCVLAGGYEALTEMLYVGFDCIQAMTTERCRPFDRKRSGLILGEAAAFLVLESEAAARKRGARILCELAGYGHTTDLHHLTRPEPSGKALIDAMTVAMTESGLSREQIGYVNAHGTATMPNDAAEIAAFDQFFGEDLKNVRLSSTKAATGHTLGAAGSLEALFTVQSLLSGQLPPQINSIDPEPFVARNLVSPGCQSAFASEAVMSVNLGFGGSNAALIFSRHDS